MWLNEGFATFVGTQAIEHLFPEWDNWTQFVSDTTNRALATDALRSSHPIEVEVKDEQLVTQNFDAISYQKGATSFRLISSHLNSDHVSPLVLLSHPHRRKCDPPNGALPWG